MHIPMLHSSSLATDLPDRKSSGKIMRDVFLIAYHLYCMYIMKLLKGYQDQHAHPFNATFLLTSDLPDVNISNIECTRYYLYNKKNIMLAYQVRKGQEELLSQDHSQDYNTPSIPRLSYECNILGIPG